MKLKAILKKILIVLVGVFVVIQFFRPEKNQSGIAVMDISHQYPVNAELGSILKTACYDCHSNKTEYPWYASIQPVAWWLADHIEEGKQHLNFNEFLSYPLHRQFHKLEEIDEVIVSNEMPMSSYTLMHRDAKLDDNQKEMLIHWSKSLMDSMRSRYPADSLVNPKKRKS